MSKKGKLIVLEGGDAAGKKTQTKLLLAHARRGTITEFDFPQYDTPVGSRIKRALIGEFGDFLHLHPVLSSALYTIDRATAKGPLEEALKLGDVVCNRYTPSNVAFQAAKLEGDNRWDFVTYLEKLEYDTLGIPTPDLVIFLDVPLNVALTLLEQRGEEQDQHEKDSRYQEKVASVYRTLAAERAPGWAIIDSSRDGMLRAPEEIHSEIWKLYQTLLATSPGHL